MTERKFSKHIVRVKEFAVNINCNHVIIKARDDRRFVHSIYRVSNASARAKQLHSLIHKASINKSMSGFFDILIGCVDIVISSWSSYICESCCVNGRPRQIFQILKFPDTLLFVIIPRMFRRNLTKIGQIYIPYKFAQSGCIRPQIKREILARQYKRFANNSRHAR